MTLSLSEVEAKARTAARGGGYPWGLAEEAGRAVRWLCAMGIDATGALSDLLTGIDGLTQADTRPRDLKSERWGATAWLCPIATGAAMSDLCRTPSELIAVRAPLLLVPFVAEACGSASVHLGWSGGGVTVWEQGIALDGSPPDISDVRLAPASARPRVVSVRRVSPDSEAWHSLDRFAHRTLAPATEESRRKGAG